MSSSGAIYCRYSSTYQKKNLSNSPSLIVNEFLTSLNWIWKLWRAPRLCYLPKTYFFISKQRNFGKLEKPIKADNYIEMLSRKYYRSIPNDRDGGVHKRNFGSFQNIPTFNAMIWNKNIIEVWAGFDISHSNHIIK